MANKYNKLNYTQEPFDWVSLYPTLTLVELENLETRQKKVNQLLGVSDILTQLKHERETCSTLIRSKKWINLCP